MQNDLRGLGQGPYIEANLKGKIIYRRQFYKQGKHVDVLMVDKLSFVSSDMLDRIDQHLRLARDMPYIPFGGLHVVFIGDLYQLPLPGGLPIFASKLWPLFELCELDGNQRAARDPAWAALLARVRVGQWTQEDIQTLESMVLKKYGNRKPAAGAVHLVATRRAVADGKECVESAHAEMLECPAVDISVNACTLLPPEKAWPLSEDTGGLEALLGLAVDMPVMLRKNMDVQDGLVNGARGVVQHIDVHESGEVQKIWVKFEKDAGSRWQRNNQCASVAIQRRTASFQDKDGDKAERRQFPLVLAKAVAIHKSQAATYHEGVHARLDASVKQEGQAYVALSRSPTKDLCTLERFDPKSLRFNANAEWALLKLKAKQAQSTGPRKPALQELWQEVIRPTEDAAYYQGKLACATPPDWKAYAEEQRLKDLEVEEGKAGSLTCPKCGFVATDTTNYKKHGRVCPAKNKKSQRPKVAGKAKAKPAMKDSKSVPNKQPVHQLQLASFAPSGGNPPDRHLHCLHRHIHQTPNMEQTMWTQSCPSSRSNKKHAVVCVRSTMRWGRQCLGPRTWKPPRLATCKSSRALMKIGQNTSGQAVGILCKSSTQPCLQLATPLTSTTQCTPWPKHSCPRPSSKISTIGIGWPTAGTHMVICTCWIRLSEGHVW